MNKQKRLARIVFFVVLTFVISFSMSGKSFAKDIQYTVTKRTDGGYTLKIVCKKRIWKPITAEGFFPVQETNHEIDFIGRGEDLSYRARPGYYYSLNKIESKSKSWDLGYAWVDPERKYLYLNLYWIKVPDDLAPINANGRYRLDEKVD
ncbi:MAG: hypothetical protein HPY65_16680 [Syntrophaceae bacterium]|nr:hypothetical protein [Syntrophaceae bacterium]HOI72877.1 hypothetical protein [Syntrophales bacterium]